MVQQKKYCVHESLVPKNLNSIKRWIKYYKVLANKQCNRAYKNYNKGYKDIKWDELPQQMFTTGLMQKIQDKYFRCFRKMCRRKQIITKRVSNKFTVKKSNIQAICLIKQVCSQIQQKYLTITSKKQIRRKKKKKVKTKKYFFRSKYAGKVYLCRYPKSLQWKIEQMQTFLKDRQYIFDSSSPFGKPMKDIKYFIRKTLVKSKVQKWDYYFNRFLSEGR